MHINSGRRTNRNAFPLYGWKGNVDISVSLLSASLSKWKVGTGTWSGWLATTTLLPLQLPSACVTHQWVACPTCRLKHQNGHATAGDQGPNPRQCLGPNPSEGGAQGTLSKVPSGRNIFCSRDSDVFSPSLAVQLCPAGALCTLLLLLLSQWGLTFMHLLFV